MIDRCGPNLAPSTPIAVVALTVAAAAAGNATRLVVPLQWGEFTEAFLVTIQNRRTLDEATPAGAAVLIGSDTDAETAALQLPAAELLMPGCVIHQALPGWYKEAVIDVIGLDLGDLATRRDVTVNVIVKRLDRTVRTENRAQ